MNQFVIYEQLCDLEDIAGRYEAGLEYREQMDRLQARIASQLYRVAVIGEFKRGKSSLVNAIIGAQVLPTDILPMTAAVTRVTYGEERRIVVHYKDGHEEESSVEQLIDFATKYDAEKEKKATTIREIDVHYPSVLCKNHIDIIDTPGLNDNEAMTDVTLGVLGDIDAAIMVISANEPLSLTEQNLILTMIGQQQIRHIIFAVTHIDAVSSLPARQDAVIEFIRGRISGDLLAKACERWSGNGLQIEKARRILEKPDVFGVSSVLAIDGFIRDDEEMLEQSRFPTFKRELLALLTAAQSADIAENTKDAARYVRTMLPQWYAAAKDKNAAERAAWQQKLDVCTAYCSGAEAAVRDLIADADMQTARIVPSGNDMLAKYDEHLRRPFIRLLSSIRESTNTTPNIKKAIEHGSEDALGLMQAECAQIAEQTAAICADMAKRFAEMRAAAGFEGEFGGYAGELPVFSWTADPVPQLPELKGEDVILHIGDVIRNSILAFADGIAGYTEGWKESVRTANAADLQERKPAVIAQSEIDRLDTLGKLIDMKYEEDLGALAAVEQILGIAEGQV